jgi:hypothetical protein
MENSNIISQVAQARGNRTALLALASSDTLDAVAHERGVSPIYAAPFVAQRLFDAKRISIKYRNQPGTRTQSRTYDLTDAEQAYTALENWGTRNLSHITWQAVENNAERYYEAAIASGGKITRHLTSELSITRHSR